MGLPFGTSSMPNTHEVSIDLSGFSSRQLESLIRKARKKKRQLATRAPVSIVRKRINDILRQEGYTLSEIFSVDDDAGTVRIKRMASPKFRNPEDPSITWSGRGKTPRWLATLLAQGRNMDEFRIHVGVNIEES